MYSSERKGVGKTLPKSLLPTEFKKLISSVPINKRKVKLSFLLGYASGLRVSEVVKLKPDNIRDTHILIENAKGGRDRIVPKPKGWKEWMISELPINSTERTLERWMKKYCLLAGLSERYVFHSLRHSFGTQLVESGVPINQVQLLMGHSNIQTTSVYTKARPMDALKSYEDLF